MRGTTAGPCTRAEDGIRFVDEHDARAQFSGQGEDGLDVLLFFFVELLAIGIVWCEDASEVIRLDDSLS